MPIKVKTKQNKKRYRMATDMFLMTFMMNTA